MWTGSCSVLFIYLDKYIKKQSVTCSEMGGVYLCLGGGREVCFVLIYVMLLYGMTHW